MDERIQKVWCIHNRTLFSFKKKKVLTYTTKGMKLEDIVLSEISQSQRDKHGTIPLTVGI